MKRRLLVLGGIIFLLQGCVAQSDYHYAKFFENHPRSVLVLPPFNESTAVDAPILFNTTVSRPFGEKGYYVFPVFLTKDVLIDMGLSDEGLLKETPLQTFKDVFGADAVLYITVKEWVTTYLAVLSSVTVAANYKLVDTTTEEVLWERTERVTKESSGSGLGALVSAALNAMLTDYRPLARQINFHVVSKPSAGLPAGPYHQSYKKDYNSFTP